MRARGRRPWLLALLTVVLVGVPVASAGACSCAVVGPRAALSRADAAFVGTVVSQRRVPGAPWSRSVEYVFSVEKAYKGDLGATVTLRTIDNSASCGLPLRAGDRAGLLLRRDEGVWTAGLCDLLDPADLEEATQPYPPAAGAGRVRLLVAGPFHDAGLVALGSHGEVIGWVFGSEGDQVSACPGSRYAVQAGDDLSVIRMSDLRVIERRPLPGDWTSAVRCLDRRGREAVAATLAFGAGSERRTLVRVTDGRVSQLAAVRASAVALGRSAAYVSPMRRHGSRLLAVSYRDGSRRRLGPPMRAGDSLALSPDGRHLAGVEGRPRRRLHVIETGSGRARSRRVDVEWPTPVWLDGQRIAVPTARSNAQVFDLRLRRIATLPGWDAPWTSVAAGRLWWLTRGGRVRSLDTDDGRSVVVGAPRLAGARGIDALTRRAVVTDASERAPRPGARAAARCDGHAE